MIIMTTAAYLTDLNVVVTGQAKKGLDHRVELPH